MIILGAMRQVGSYIASFHLLQLCLFPEEEPRGRLVLFCKYQSHGSGEILFLFAQIESFLPNMCKYLLSSSWAFRCFKKTTFRQFSYKQCQSSLPLALKKRSLISQFKNFSLGGNIYRKNKWLDNHCWKKRRNVWLKIFIFLNYR